MPAKTARSAPRSTTIVAPAIEILRRDGIDVRGPLPADTMFHAAARKTYDCAICMYHDQALIPIKTLAFDDAVNVTLGLPFIRTSPDHGTAFDIAGTGQANPSSLIAALRLAARMAATQAGMSAIDDLPPLRDVIREHALSARKSLGQNFLLDLNLTARIARAAGPLEDATVIEIGPGPGGLTRALLALGAQARHRDRARRARAGAARGYLEALSRPAGDHLRRRAAFRSAPAARRRTRENRRQPALQYRDRAADRLAVDRAVAALVRHDGADVPARGRRAHRRARERRGLWPARVLANWRAETKILFDISPAAFVPQPKVTSSVVRLVPRAAPEPCDRRALEQVAAAAFGQRRKMLRQSLKSLAVDPARLAAAARCRSDAARRDHSGLAALLPWPAN